ncbi:hypothetical protein Ac2012v2_008282 [Leucoagaricus gongylophorus]
MAATFTPHPCKVDGQTRCEREDCAINSRYDGLRDPDGRASILSAWVTNLPTVKARPSTPTPRSPLSPNSLAPVTPSPKSVASMSRTVKLSRIPRSLSAGWIPAPKTSVTNRRLRSATQTARWLNTDGHRNDQWHGLGHEYLE